ncbi:MAG TPA: endonuclease/exonuclease/phosphatase family protein [Tepidisphaeraceae bacterium]|jgi:endonuclease/exonuclease/phosphatase family metal-dependent hydrolase|nr:endonuclease/exonuclease/phosphatase family protein [Tepidisphaeraceae bacterium]
MTIPLDPTSTLAGTRPLLKSRLWIWLIALSGALAVWFYGYLRLPTGPASGSGFSGTLSSLPKDKKIFRVATFNMHSGVGEDDVFNLGRTIDAVRDTDFCGLQEVRGFLYGPASSQAQQLAGATAHAWLFAPTERRYWHDEFGNGVLTRLPVENWVRIPLPIEPVHSGRRNAFILRVDFAGRIVPVIVAHIDREKDQTNQLLMVARLFDSLQSPSLLLADLNAEAKNPQVQSLLSLDGVHNCIHESNSSADSAERIDWIISRGFNTVAGGHIQNGASDHPLYWADLVFER